MSMVMIEIRHSIRLHATILVEPICCDIMYINELNVLFLSYFATPLRDIPIPISPV